MRRKRKSRTKPGPGGSNWAGRHSEFIKAAIIVFIIGLVLRIFVFSPLKVENVYMEDTFQPGDFVLVSQLAYKFVNPQPGDIVVFEHPFQVGQNRIGRVIAIAGQTIQVIGKEVYIDDQPYADTPKQKHTDSRLIPVDYSNRDFVEPVQVPAGAVYILCDNRDQAEDSRNFGTVNIDNIKGKGLFVYWSWKPDPGAPEWESPYIIPAIQILFYNLFHFPTRIGWDRLGAAAD